jgi:hypothetical protein
MFSAKEKPRLSWRSEVVKKVFNCKKLTPFVLLSAYEEVLDEQKSQGRLCVAKLLQELTISIAEKFSQEFAESQIDCQLRSLIATSKEPLSFFIERKRAVDNLLLLYENYLALTTREKDPSRLKEDAETLLIRSLWESF